MSSMSSPTTTNTNTSTPGGIGSGTSSHKDKTNLEGGQVEVEGGDVEGNAHAILSSDVTSTANTSVLAAAVSEAQRRQETPMLPVVERVDDDDDDNNNNFDGFTHRADLESQSNRELRMQAPHRNSATADFKDTESDIVSIATTPTRRKTPPDNGSLFSDATVRRRSRLLLTFGRRSSATTAIGGDGGGGSVTGEARTTTAGMMSTGRSGGSSNYDAASDSHEQMGRSPTSLLCFPRRTRDAVHEQRPQRPTILTRAQESTASNPSFRAGQQPSNRLLHAASTQSAEGATGNALVRASGHQKPPRQLGGGSHTASASNSATASVASLPSSQGQARAGGHAKVQADARHIGVKGSGGSGRKLVRDVSLQRDEFIEFATGVSSTGSGSHNGALTHAGGSGHSLTGSVFGFGQGSRRNGGEKGAPRWLIRLLSSGGIELESRRLNVDYLDDDDDMYDDDEEGEDGENGGGEGADEDVHEAKAKAGEDVGELSRLQHRRTVGGESGSNGHAVGEGRKAAKKWRLWSKRS